MNNKYKIDINLVDVFVNREEHIYDGSFGNKLGFRRGRNSVVAKNFIPELEYIYPGSGLKIFSTNHRVHKITQIQRMFSWYGLAPKVYKHITIESAGKDYHAQVIEYDEGEYCFNELEMRNILSFVRQIAEKYHIYFNDDVWASNAIRGRWVDFGLKCQSPQYFGYQGL